MLGNDKDGVTGVRLASTVGEPDLEQPVTGVFLAIGHTPNTSLFEGQLELKDGYMVVQGGREGNATATSVEGVFAAGDCTTVPYKQIVIAAGAGATAALSAFDHLIRA